MRAIADDAGCGAAVEPLRTTARTLADVPRWDDAERAALVALLRARPSGQGWPRLVAKVNEMGSARAAWDAARELSLFDGRGDDELHEAARDITAWRSAGLRFLTFLDEDYPAQLREIHQLPPVLFSRGALRPEHRAVSVVGSRRASERGLHLAQALAEALVDTDTTVISGLATGIDTAAHTAALASRGRTVAVIGTGINRVYPAANRGLQEQIAHDGLVLSQFWPDAPPQKHTFLMRNATMSGYGRATIVVEAGETSGARVQARLAVEHGRPVILTDLVVKATEWARALESRPGVYVAGSVEEVLAIVDEVTQDLGDVVDALLAKGR